MTNENNEEMPKPILLEDLGMLYATKDSKKRRRFGLYKCGFCGEEFKTMLHNVKRGYIKSCGCHRKRKASETRKTHGLSNTRLNRIWSSIKDRTLNIKTSQYINYGDRGITICDEWKNDFMSFYNWAILNGYEENKGISIDRIDNDGNYEPNNCRWTTSTIQSRNRRIHTNNTSGFKGVCLVKKTNKYKSYITVDKNRVFLGYFPTPEEGAIAYNNYIIENNLEGYNLNEIPLVNLIK